MKKTLYKILALVTSVMLLFSTIPMSVEAIRLDGWTTYTVTAWSDFGSATGNVWAVGMYPKTGGTIVLPDIANGEGVERQNARC